MKNRNIETTEGYFPGNKPGKFNQKWIINTLVAASFIYLSGCMPYVMKTLPVEDYQVVDQYSNKSMKEVKLTKDTKLYAVKITKGTRLSISDYGRVYMILPSRDIEINGVKIPANSKAYVQEETPREYISFIAYKIKPNPEKLFKLWKVELAQNLTLGSNHFKRGSVLQFNKPPILDNALLAGQHSLGGQTFADGSEVWFNMVGDVNKSRTKEERQAYKQKENMCKASCAHLSDMPDASHINCINSCM